MTDGWGLNGSFDESTIEFDAPMTTIAMDFPGTLRIQLFSNDQLIYTSPLLGSGGTGFFRGLISTEAFDKVHIDDPLSGLFIDNLYFGPPIPAPPALALIAAAALLGQTRRRSRVR